MRRARVVPAALLVVLSGCASLPPGARPVAHDPFERANRSVFAFNDGLDRAVTKPLAQGYRAVVPEFMRRYIGNFFGNLGDVFTSANQLLQGKPVLALSDAGRVLVNTVFGFGGVIDVASDLGLEKHREDFGQTLGRWGAGSGPYLVLPVFGPSSVRDGLGLGVDLAADPLQGVFRDVDLAWAAAARVVDTRERLLSAERLVEGAALDRYSFLRDAYLQRRRSQIHDGDPPPLDEEDEVDAGASGPASTASGRTGPADPAAQPPTAPAGAATPAPTPAAAGQTPAAPGQPSPGQPSAGQPAGQPAR